MLGGIDNTADGGDSWQIATLTYNINGQKPLRDGIFKWLNHESELRNSKIVSVALQEISHAEIFSSALRYDEGWTDGLNEWFYEHDFVLVGSENLASNLILIYCVPSILNSIALVDYKWTRTTFAGHKGTVSCRLLFKDGLSLIFLASHFLHGEENLQLRLEQYRSSLQCTFDNENSPYSHERLRSAAFWMGDFNFRIEGYRQSSKSLILMLNKAALEKERNKVNSLLTNLLEHHDQLTKCRCSGKIFKGFQEPLITFLPTYRIRVGSKEYDPLRTPSWCDRILYKTSSNLSAQLSVLNYSSYREITISDHFPVLAIFRLRNDDKKSTRKQHTPRKAHENSPKVLPRQFRWLCVFSVIPTWAPLIPFVCRFRIDALFWRTSSAYRDWLGIYNEKIGTVAKPLHWVYVFMCYNDDTAGVNSPRRSVSPGFGMVGTSTSQSSLSTFSSEASDGGPTLKMVAEFPALQPGRYRVGYFSIQRNCLQGLSEVFSVSESNNST